MDAQHFQAFGIVEIQTINPFPNLKTQLVFHHLGGNIIPNFSN
jgi:hypothetical protein